MSIIVKLQWWMWNQMFQYALWKHLSILNNTDLKLDLSFLQKKAVWYTQRDYELHTFKIDVNFANEYDIPWYENRIINKYLKYWFTKLNSQHIKEKQFHFDEEILKIKKNNIYLEGFWQTEKYFNDIEKVIRKEFNFINETNITNKKLINKILNEKNSVSFHVRRWDYVSNENTNKFHWICSIEYYNKAYKIIKNKLWKLQIYFFSDDINWAKQTFKFNEKCEYIDYNTWKNSYKDLELMSICKHNIISNSTFSWWSARLNNNPNKIIISPSKRFNDNNKINANDIVPNEWIKI